MVQQNLQESVEFIRSKTSLKPAIGLVLGSGLGNFVNRIDIECQLPYHEIPHFLAPTIEGHSGSLVFGHCEGIPVAALQGRCHYYEGHSMEKIVHPVRTLAMLGIKSLLLTNSAGGIDQDMTPGDFMVIEDHINLMGSNPLMGPNLKNLGPRFPDMTEAYDKELRQLLSNVLTKHGVNIHRGVYCALSGPTYETPAEIRFLKTIGANAVGMSTVPEVIAANHLGLRVSGISCITNKASGLSQEKLSHDEVTAIAKKVDEKFGASIEEFIGTVGTL